MKQLDLMARDALRLQREIPNMPDEKEPPRQKFASANSKGDQTTQQTIEKANIGVVYNRPVKPPVFTNDGGVLVRAPQERIAEQQIHVHAAAANN